MFELKLISFEYQAIKLTTRVPTNINLEAPSILYIGQAFRYSPEDTFYIFNQQIYFII